MSEEGDVQIYVGIEELIYKVGVGADVDDIIAG
jgi:hypothetical protein